MTIYSHPFFKKKCVCVCVCVCVFSSTAMFFLSPRGEKISWPALALAWEDFLLYLGGMGGQGG